jgi:response regulator RpfG family c-di-GMP phosphodiesterase
MGMENVIYIDGFQTLSEWERYLVEIYCANVSVAFENIYLNQELESTQKEIIYTMGEITETRSKETGHHVKRVAEYSRLLALKYELSEQEAEVIRLASPMHDVGKVGIPDAILNKPGPLTEEEFEVIKAHASLGYEMLKHSNKQVLNAAATIAQQHHEKYDGSGYPLGLKGENIHIYGRITAVADVFDALCSDRVYKKAWEMDRVLDFLQSQKHRHFDPILVDLFLTHLDEFLMIKEKYAK